MAGYLSRGFDMKTECPKCKQSFAAAELLGAPNPKPRSAKPVLVGPIAIIVIAAVVVVAAGTFYFVKKKKKVAS